ncbi:hypothetical protein C1645_822147 [Glomus cerebriforme]|uniref:Myb/SANT-like DNA-binding domain-containing protein n=1 Tax=Glomus cerebriforme TaxID=658196 RepID=A0A397T5A7_9GLOM|nr:hypothetical protein C1645_822147 [Glomus cerebriforme]
MTEYISNELASNASINQIIFFYTQNDITYLIQCEESSPGSITDYSFSNTLIFTHEQLNINKTYRLVCKKLSVTFIYQILNNIFFNIDFNLIEQQQREFSIKDQENLKTHLKKDLIYYLELNRRPNDFLYHCFLKKYYDYESMMISQQNSLQDDSYRQEFTNDQFVSLPSHEQPDGFSGVEGTDEKIEVIEAVFDKLLQISSSFQQFHQNEVTSSELTINPEPSSNDIEGKILMEEANPPSEGVESSNESESSTERTRSSPCDWSEEGAVECLLSYLKENKDLARKRGGINWEQASTRLREHNFDFSAKQCSTKWKNIKRESKKNMMYKSQVEEILGKNDKKKKKITKYLLNKYK